MKFTVTAKEVKNVAVVPDYHTGGRDNGPLAWLRVNGEPTGTAIVVAGCERTACEHSINYHLEDSEFLSDFAVDGQPTDRASFFKALAEACYALS